MMTLEVIRTSDGSDTLFRGDLNQHYHSTFGAVQESRHIFIETGLLHLVEKLTHTHRNGTPPFHLLEIGFGTGLNALLTQAEAEKHGIPIKYTAIEAFPLEERYWRELNYPHFFSSDDISAVFTAIHDAKWNEAAEISPHFTLNKIHCTLEAYFPEASDFDLIYFDAFGPDAQPELWTDQIFQHLYNGLCEGGVLVTYSVKGAVVRALRAAGFQTEKLSGPPGKRHILRATKI